MLLTPQKDELIGQILNDRYKVVEEVGRGGMSAVYKGIHELMDRTVAIKVLLPQLVSDQISIKRFQQEAQAASHLQHPNVITVYDYGFVASGQPYLVMDFLEGESLSDIIKRDKQCQVKRMIPIFIQACEALEHAHQKGVIHRDLKSSNIMLIDFEGKKDFVKVVDFGIAKLMPSSGKQSQNLTQTGEVFGSPIYMSPEQCMAQSLDARSDIYSMGAMMYESLTGQPPLMGNSIIDTMQMHMSTPPKPFSEARPDISIPEALERVVLKALAKKPEQRYQSMQELRDALEGVSRLIDKEKLFGPGPAGKALRGTRPRMTTHTPAAGKTTGAAPAASAPKPKMSYEKDSNKSVELSQSTSTAEPPRATAARAPKPAPRKPEKQPEKEKPAKVNPLDKIKQMEIFQKVPLPVVIAAVVVLGIVIPGSALILSKTTLPSFLSTQKEVQGVVWFYQPSTKRKVGKLNLFVASQDEETPGELKKLEIPADYNLDDRSDNAQGAGIGDYWKVMAHGMGDKLVLETQNCESLPDSASEDLRQIINCIKDMFNVLRAPGEEVNPEAIMGYYMPEWASDGMKKLNVTWGKIVFNEGGDPMNVPKSSFKVEMFDKDQGKAHVLVKTAFWIEKGPRYYRFVLVKKDNKKWLIARIEEISPKIWTEDGIVQEMPEEEQAEEEE